MNLREGGVNISYRHILLRGLSYLADLIMASDVPAEDVWSGGNKLGNGVNWTWTDGTPWDYNHWRPGNYKT